MIQIQAVKFPETEEDLDIKDYITIAAANLAVDHFIEGMTRELNDLQCEEHPDQVSIVKFIADKQSLIRVDKSNFCCTKFADSVKITVK